MAVLDQFLQQLMGLAKEPMGSPNDFWWLMKTVSGVPFHFQQIVPLFFTHTDLVDFVRTNKKVHGKLDHWPCLLYKGRCGSLQL